MKSTMDDTRAFVASPFYDHWRSRVESTGGCLHPIRLAGTHQITHKHTGAVLHDRSGQIMAACGTRREALCPPCAERYSNDAFHIIRAGLAGDDTKGVDATVVDAPRRFVTLTAPGFGAVHTRHTSTRGFTIPCACGEKHHAADPRIHGAIDPDTYDYEAAVLWNAHAGALWHRFCINVRRRLARHAGIRAKDLGDHLRVSYAKVAEYQKRGLIHFHAAVRLDGPDGPGTEAPAWATPELLHQAIDEAAASTTVTTFRPTGEVFEVRWGKPDVKEITAPDVKQLGEPTETDKKIAAQRLASYVAKYATKSTGVTESGVDRHLLSRTHIEELPVTEHYKRMMVTAWDLGGLACYEGLNLRRWAHMLGFRGHFLTKSIKYSTTFKALKATRQLHRVAELLESLDVSEDEITVLSHWEFGGVGYRNEVESELAEAIGQRIRSTKQSRKE